MSESDWERLCPCCEGRFVLCEGCTEGGHPCCEKRAADADAVLLQELARCRREIGASLDRFSNLLGQLEARRLG